MSGVFLLLDRNQPDHSADLRPHRAVDGPWDHTVRSDLIYWFVMLVALNLQTSFLTLPLGFALFYQKGATGNAITMG